MLMPMMMPMMMKNISSSILLFFFYIFFFILFNFFHSSFRSMFVIFLHYQRQLTTQATSSLLSSLSLTNGHGQDYIDRNGWCPVIVVWFQHLPSPKTKQTPVISRKKILFPPPSSSSPTVFPDNETWLNMNKKKLYF